MHVYNILTATIIGWSRVDTVELTDLHEYIQKSIQERQEHLDLDSPCLEIGADSQESRGLMAMHLKIFLTKQVKVHLCHACGNPKCSNPSHLYWGTPSENSQDTQRHNPGLGLRVRDTLLRKNPNHYRDMALARREGNRYGNLMSPEQIKERLDSIKHLDPHKWGFYTKVSKIWGLTPQASSRFYRQHFR